MHVLQAESRAGCGAPSCCFEHVRPHATHHHFISSHPGRQPCSATALNSSRPQSCPCYASVLQNWWLSVGNKVFPCWLTKHMVATSALWLRIYSALSTHNQMHAQQVQQVQQVQKQLV